MDSSKLLRKAQEHEASAAILRKEVECKSIADEKGYMSDEYRKAVEQLTKMREDWMMMYGGTWI